jgi:hypothetical protein
MIDLKDDQLQDIIQSVLNKEEGLNELLELILNGLKWSPLFGHLVKHIS